MDRLRTLAVTGVLALLSACGGGDSGGGSPTSQGPDTTPDALSFVALAGAPLSATATSTEITITGINAAAAVSVTGGEYSIDGGAFTSAPGSISNNQKIKVRAVTSAQFSTPSSVILTVGGVVATFSVTTVAIDTTPDTFSFVAQAGVARSVTLASAEITLTGTNSDAPVTITGGEYSIDGGTYSSAATTIRSSQKIRVRLTTSAQFSTPVSAVLSIGGVAGAFIATTEDLDIAPAAIQFTRVENVMRGAWASSAPITITDINAPSPVTIVDGEYSINGGAFTGVAGQVSSGQNIVVRVRAATLYSRASRATLSVGGVTAAFEAMSELPLYIPDKVAHDGQDIVYLLSNANRMVFRWSIGEARYLDALILPSAGATPTQMTYSAFQDRLFLGYVNGDITYFQASAPAATATTTFLARTPTPLGGLVAVGKFLMAQDSTGPWRSHFVFNSSGTITDQEPWNYYSGEYAWDAATSRVYFFRDDTSPNDLHYEVIDQNSGLITFAGETPYHGAYNITPPIRVSSTGQFVLLGSGDIYDKTGLTWSGSLGGVIADARWLAGDSLVTLANSGGQTVLRRLSGTQLILQEQVTYTGQALRVLGSDARMAVLLVVGGTVQIRTYVPSDDSDGDGVINTQDAFALDRAASVDSDGDGYPDAWNAGRTQADSTMGLQLDAFPQDSACWLSSHGSGSTCNYAATIPAYVPDQIAQQGDVVYLLSRANRRVYRWSLSQRTYLNPYIVGTNQGFSTLTPTHMAISSAHQRLYLGYSNGAIRFLDTTMARPVEQQLAILAMSVEGLAAVGNFVLAQDYSGAWATHYIISGNGTITDHLEWNYYSREYAWDPITTRVYLLRDSQFPGALQYEVIDQANGRITTTGSAPYHGQSVADPPIRVSVNGQYVLLGTGDLYERTVLSWAGSIGGQITDARWMGNGSLVTMSPSGGQTILRRLASANLAVLEQLSFAGTPLRVVGTDTAMTVIAVSSGTVQFHSFVPSDDSDGDGVLNTQDAFPLDRSASLDTDADGYPDSWNAGRTQADSTTGLVLDAYPQDSACWLSAHGSGGICDYSATLPAYTPDQVLQQGDVVYLLSSANKRVYRWSISAGRYLNPYVVGIPQGFSTLAPVTMAHSANTQRLYLGYDNGVIRYIATNGANASETQFAIAGAGVTQLVSTGNFLYVNAALGYTFNEGGVLQAQFGGAYSSDLAWDAVTSRLYLFADGSSPNDLYYEVINQTTGQMTGSGETPYHGAYSIEPPIRVSVDGQRVLLGSGDIYNQNGLTWAGSLGAHLADARWMADGSLVTLTTNGAQTTLRHLSSTGLVVLEQRTLLGAALRVVGSDAVMAVVVIRNGTVAIQNYVPTGDSDGDGVNNTQDAYPQDPSASVDTDHDGHPDAWNAGKSQADSTTGLVLDAFPQDSACWLAGHGSGGVCNFASTVPAYVPDKVVSQGNIIYLLSEANSRVYRWSMATGQYLNPYVVGINEGFGTLMPTRMAISPVHQRLYLSYSTGAIRYLDLSVANPQEVPFANTSLPVLGLASVGNYVLAQDDSGAWATHYVFSSTGQITDQREWNYRSSDYAWDPVSSRVYFFRDDTSPNDLHYEVINQSNGLITSAGETPYHGDFSYIAPIRVSPDGEVIMVGTGDLYARSSLLYAGNLGTAITDARYANNVLVTLSTDDRIDIRSATSRAQLISYQYLGQPLHVAVGTSEGYLVHVVNGTTAFVRLPFYDADGDTLPRWWEQLYNLNDAVGADASFDPDGDGLNNAAEYANRSNPTLADTDGDGLSDSQEVLTYLTSPVLADTDGDKLSDAAEVLLHHTNPNAADSDTDGFSDRDEVSFGGDPNDGSRLPVPMTGYSQTFEGSPDLSLWSQPAGSFAPWALSSTTAHGGTGSLKSGTISSNQRSSVQLHGYFTNGQISFWARLDTGTCCDRLEVRIDGTVAISTLLNAQWNQYTIPVTLGIHEIEWAYQKAAYSYDGTQAVWIDDVVFGP